MLEDIQGSCEAEFEVCLDNLIHKHSWPQKFKDGSLPHRHLTRVEEKQMDVIFFSITNRAEWSVGYLEIMYQAFGWDAFGDRPVDDVSSN